ncbi:hypothetical protein ACFQ05_06655 [Amycolatopsis umgeniensis]|uniref:Uncharacterized protein n=1 Tax=Amycolatopsis umgeniensis TaxID=336628 RepID=A0A841AVN8_9PSEU|nr:hypothetical protein [Amycolatopsis umgeniensis]MBB5852959.1 hypothetical protein [Amycolatopsis umgeniensis]
MHIEIRQQRTAGAATVIGVPCAVVNTSPLSSLSLSLPRRSSRSFHAAVTMSIKDMVSSDIDVFVWRCGSFF